MLLMLMLQHIVRGEGCGCHCGLFTVFNVSGHPQNFVCVRTLLSGRRHANANDSKVLLGCVARTGPVVRLPKLDLCAECRPADLKMIGTHLSVSFQLQ